MEIQEFIDKITKMYSSTLEYLEHEDDNEAEFQNLLQLFTEIKITENKYDLKEALYIILNIANNHLPHPLFLPKILRLLDYFKSSVQNNFSNFEIFRIFQSNKRFLLYFIEEKILKITSTMVIIMKNYDTYLEYFYPEIKEFMKFKKSDEEIYNDETFNEKRRKAENEHKLCELIRKDSIEDFISYINLNDIQINSDIPESIFETNRFLLNKYTSMIEYSAFYGSIRIFQYLITNKAELRPNIWMYSMHGKNPEILQILEEKLIKPSDDDFTSYLYESMKCHHNDFSSYFQENYMNNICDMQKLQLFSVALKYHNYAFFPTAIKNKFVFYDLCKYDYDKIVDLFLKTTKINVKAKIVFIIFVLFS